MQPTIEAHKKPIHSGLDDTQSRLRDVAASAHAAHEEEPLCGRRGPIGLMFSRGCGLNAEQEKERGGGYKMFDTYVTLSADQYNAISKKYEEFQRTCDDVTKEPIKVYSPLSQKNLEELYLIREVSKTLQKKKEEDMKKAAQAAAEQEKKAEEEKPEEKEKTEEESK
ncbi:unnamed protein product [Spodoptera exigua]|nr:unnamed protein product [Spodoptera exigua]